MEWLNNICWLTDSYKVSHWLQYPFVAGHRRTRCVRSYFESRTGSTFPQTVFYGLQYYCKQYLAGQTVTKDKINQAEELFNEHFGSKVFNREGWDYILNKHGGYLPIEIKAVLEGTTVNESNVLMTVENTDENFSQSDTAFWLTNWLETLLTQTWYPSTVATQSFFMKKVILKYLHLTGTPELIDYKLHDFGFRGVTCPEQAAIGASAHLLNFRGTDTVPGIVMARHFYHERMAGHSIPAAEHSTITSWGKEHEIDACRNMLEKYPDGMVAVVSDSYDIYNCCENIWGGVLKESVLARNGVLVIRPDSGHPPTVCCKLLEILGEKFGFTVNSKGYKVLHPKVRLIQGDGIDFQMLDLILNALMKAGWSADNIAFGSGGGLLQKLNRDTQKFAFKCSSIDIEEDGILVSHDVYKQPKTDSGKKSKAGRFKLVFADNGELITVPATDPRPDQLQVTYRNGIVLIDQNFAEIRSRIPNFNPLSI